MTPNIDLVLSIPGVSENYVDNINDNLEKIDSHNHSDSGNILTQESINWDEIDFDGTYIENSSLFSFFNLDDSTNIENSLYLKYGNFYFFDNNSNEVQLTSNGALNFLATFNGFFGDMISYDASCVYDSAENSYTFQSFSSRDTSSALLYFKDLECENISASESIITTSFTNDTQVQMVTSGNFPGDIGTDYESTFYINNDGILKASYITSENEPGSFLASGTMAVGGNIVSFMYPATEYLRGNSQTLVGSKKAPVNYNPTALSGTIDYIYGGYRADTPPTPDSSSYGVQCIANPISILDTASISYNFQTGVTQARPIYMNVVMTPSDSGIVYTFGPSGALYCEFYIKALNNNSPLFVWGFSHNIIFAPSTEENNALDVSQLYTQIVSEGSTHTIEGGTNPDFPFPDYVYPHYWLCFCHNNTQGLTLTSADFKVSISFWGVWLSGANYG